MDIGETHNAVQEPSKCAADESTSICPHAAFIGLFCVYLVLRIIDVHDTSTRFYYVQSLDVLACGAILLFPRLCFLFVSKSPMILGLRAMFKRFTVLLALSTWSLLGFWLTFWLMGGGRYTPMRILKVRRRARAGA